MFRGTSNDFIASSLARGSVLDCAKPSFGRPLSNVICTVPSVPMARPLNLCMSLGQECNRGSGTLTGPLSMRLRGALGSTVPDTCATVEQSKHAQNCWWEILSAWLGPLCKKKNSLWAGRGVYIALRKAVHLVDLCLSRKCQSCSVQCILPCTWIN